MWVPLRPVLLGAFLAGASASAPGCKRDPADPDTRRANARGNPGNRLPNPWPLPREPDGIVFVRNPGELLAQARAYSNRVPPDAEVSHWVLDGVQRPTLEAKLSDTLSMDRPWILAHIEQETIVALPIGDDRVEAVGKLLSTFTPTGKFGAVLLPTPQTQPDSGPAGKRDPRRADEAPAVAWLDRERRTLFLAETLRGLATGPKLEGAYGHRAFRMGIGRSIAKLTGDTFPFERLEITGDALDSFELRLRELDRTHAIWMSEITPGALTGLLTSSQIAWGISSRWAEYEDAVGTVIKELTARVRDQNFLIRGVLEDLLRQLNAVLRAWNGKVMVGGGPANHMLAALGTEDTARAERAVLHLARGILDNLKLADTFGFRVPSLSLKKNARKVGDIGVHQITLGRANELVPSDVAPLLDGHRLRVAMAFPAHAGAALVVAGPQAAEAAARWVRESKASRAKYDGTRDLASASFAVSPQSLRPVIETQSPMAGLAVEADRPATLGTLREEGNELVVRVHTEPDSGSPPTPAN